MVILVINGVYVLVLQPTRTPRPLTIAYPTVREGGHLNPVAVERIREIVVVDLDRVPTSSDTSKQVLVLTDERRGRIVLDTVKCVRHGSRCLL